MEGELSAPGRRVPRVLMWTLAVKAAEVSRRQGTA